MKTIAQQIDALPEFMYHCCHEHWSNNEYTLRDK